MVCAVYSGAVNDYSPSFFRKTGVKNIDSMAMTWLQQAVAMPIIVGALFLAKFYWPGEMSLEYWGLMAVYVVLVSLVIFLYFKALNIADITYVAPLLTLQAVGNIFGAYIVLNQVPTLLGMLGAVLIMSGAYLNNLAKRRQKSHSKENKLALLFVLGLVVINSFNANLEVILLRQSNATSFNFYSSVLCVPFVLAVSLIVIRGNQPQSKIYWSTLRAGIHQHFWPLVLVGVTYTINILATYQAKLIGPNAGYVGAIKSASVLPIVLIGIFFFKEKVVRMQWVGIVLIIFGLAAIATN